ncbi:MAG: proline dehydrogenase [Candidatus Marinimicrobia bacterium]|nr:proline dehydrogenase [Candidatus Neomarinimicrobiota bacterium]
MFDEAGMLLLNSESMNPLNSMLAAILPIFPRWLIKPFAKPYVAGESMTEALQHIKVLNDNGFAVTVDILGEHVQTREEASKITKSYTEILNAIAEQGLDCNISIKPTHIGLDISYETARDNLFSLLAQAKNKNNFVRIDMENSPYTDASIKMYLEALIHYQNVGPVIQAYLHRSPDDISRLNGEKLNVRICKGIYKESETIALKNKSDINDQYVDLVKAILNGGGYAGIATHDLTLINALDEWIIENQISPDRFEFQILYGVPMAGRLEELLEKGYKVRQYVPYGEEWFEYSVRRLKENPVIITYVFKNMFKSR